jgi:hypothetical protein
MKRARAAVIILALATSACVSGGSEHRPAPTAGSSRPGSAAATEPVTDSVPYWCDLVPRRALTRVTGVSSGLSEVRNAGAHKNRSLCGVKDGARYGPLAVQWDVEGGRNEIADWMKDVASDHPARLPAELGSGFTVVSRTAARLPYFTASAFACGPHDAWIEIFVRAISPGRNPTQDLIDLMRIAQRRFGRLHRCVPGG